MSFRSTALLFGLLLGMLWVFGLMLAYKRTVFDERAIVATLPPAQDVTIDSLTVRHKDKEYHFTHEGEVWTLKGDKASIRLDNFRINQIVNDIRSARKNLEADVRDEPAQYGLDAPAALVTIHGKTGLQKNQEREWQLKIGNESGDKSLVYVMSSDQPNRVSAVNKSALESVFFKNANQLRARSLFEFSDTAVKQLVLREDKKDVQLKKNEDETWRFVQPALGFADAEGTAPAKDAKDTKDTPASKSDGGVKGLIATIRGLRVEGEEDFVPATETNPADFGLEEGKENMRVQVVTKEERKDDILLIGKKVSPTSDQYYARMANDMGMFKLSARQLEPIRKLIDNPGQLRSLDIVPTDIKKVDLVKLTLGKDTVELTRPEEKQWKVQEAGQKPGKANDKAIESFLEAVQGKREIRSFEAGDAKNTDGDMAAEIALSTDSQTKKKDEKPDDKKDTKKDGLAATQSGARPAVTLTIGKGDKESVPVKRVLADGTTSRFTISRAVADKILPANGGLAFLDTALPSFAAEDATRLTLQRGKDQIDIVRGSGKDASRWLFAGATESQQRSYADSDKVGSLLKSLGTLSAKKWVQRVDAKADLATFGLNDPAVTASVVIKKQDWSPTAAAGVLGLLGSPLPLTAGTAALAAREGDKGETIVFRFGKEPAEDKERPGMYATRTGVDVLFLVGPEIVRTVKDIDLRDRSMILAAEAIVQSGVLALGPHGMLGTLPLQAHTVQSFDPAAAKEIKLEIRTTAELRRFHFVREGKDKGWQDQSKLLEFQLDPAKVNALLEQMSKLQADRWVGFGGGDRPEYKFDPKESTLRLEIVLNDDRTVTLTVGDQLDRLGYFARSSEMPAAVFLLSTGKIEPYLRGTAYFGKERLAAQ